MIKKILYLLILNSILSFSQNDRKVDSLLKRVKRFDIEKSKNKSLQDSVKVNLLLKISNLYNMNNPVKQYEFGQRSLKLSNKIQYTKGIAMAYLAIARSKNDVGKYNESRVIANKAIHLIEPLNEYKILGDLYFCLAQSFIFKSDLANGLFYLNKAIKNHDKVKDIMGLAHDYNNIAVLYLKQTNYDKTLYHFNRVIQLLTKYPSKRGDSFKNLVNSNIGVIYINQKKFESALKLLKECLVNDSIAGRINGIAYNKMNIGQCYLSLKLPQKAIVNLNESKKIFIESKNNSALGDNYRILGEAFYQLNQIDKAIDYVSLGLKYSSSIGDLEAMKFGYNLLSEIYSKKENYKLALENYILFKKISDSILNADVKSKITQVQLTHKFNGVLDNLKTEQSKKATRQKVIIYTFIGILFSLAIITFLIYNNLKRHKKQKIIIESQNKIIKESLKEKEILLKEIHHRVKNNLQIISSLLNIQAEDIDDEKVLSSINEGKSRVEAMSLIHQNLYQSELINKVNFDKYISDITTYLDQMYHSDDKNVQILLNVNEIEFDIDTAIPLGLIINELVSNSFKYAFVYKNEGEIHIELMHLHGDSYELKVSDNGVGLPPFFDIKKVKSLGLSLVTILAEQLDGKLEIIQQKNFIQFCITFKYLNKNSSYD